LIWTILAPEEARRGLGLAEQILDPLRAALGGVVDVHPARRTARPVPILGARASVGAPGGVEDDDAARPGHGAQQRLDLRVVGALHRVVVVQVAHGGRVAQQLEPLVVERQGIGERPQVLDRHGVALGVEEDLRRAAGVGGAVERGLGVRGRDEGERRADAGRGPAAGGGSAIEHSLVHAACLLVGVADARPWLASPRDVGAATARRQRVRFTAT